MDKIQHEFTEQVGNAEYFYTSDFKLSCFLRSQGAAFKSIKNFGTLEHPHFRFEFIPILLGVKGDEAKEKFKELRAMWAEGLDNKKTNYCVAVLNANKELKMALKINIEKQKAELLEKHKSAKTLQNTKSVL